jgi:putative ABC transport system permease protein
MSKLLSLLRNLFRRRVIEDDLEQNVRSYLQLLVDEKVASGLSEADARRQAQIELGGVLQVKESVREVRMGALLDTVWLEVRYSLRMLRKTPGFTGVAVLTLALGIGANTAVFSVFSSVVLRPLPYERDEQIVAIWEKRIRENSARSHIPAPDFLDWRRMNKNFVAIALYDTSRQNVSFHREVELVPAARVTGGFFEVLGVRVRMGRTIQVADEEPTNSNVAILTYTTWQRRFGADPEILNRTILVNGESHQVAGVLPETFRYPFAAACEVFLPLRFTEDQRRYRGIHTFDAIGRIRDGVTLDHARAEMEVISKQLEKEHPGTNTGHVASMTPLREELTAHLKPALLVLMGSVVLVILITCANVANLLLARACVRARETAVRAALGCSRSRLVMHSLAESTLLAIGGACGGIVLAWWGLSLLRSSFFQDLDFFATAGLDQAGIDWRVLAFTVFCAVFSTLLFGISPAFARARVNLNQSLRSGGRGSVSAESQNLHSMLVIVQVALSLMLLAGAGLLGKSFLRLMNVNLGFRPESVTTATVRLPGSQYRTIEQAAQFFDALVERVALLPGIQSAAITDILPLTGGDNRSGVDVQGYQPRSDERVRMHPRLVSPDYLTTMGIRLIAGRMFAKADTTEDRHLAIVSEGTAQRYWPHESAVGKRFHFTVDKGPWFDVIGVVASVHNRAPDQDPTPDVYLPFRENPFRYVPTRVALVLKTELNDGALAASLRSAIASLDRSVAVADVRSMGSIVEESAAPRWFNLLVLSTFAVTAIVLAASGLYGILSYLVNQRSAEIGIRMALGAGKLAVLRMVIGRGAALACAGIVLGTVGSLAATHLLSKLLFDVHPRDPAVFFSIPAFLLAIALLASYVPARRAAKVDPLVALRTE